MDTLVEPQTAHRPWTTRLCSYLDKYEMGDPAPFGPLVVAFCVYAFILLMMGSRPLWYDELCTYYIAKAPNMRQFVVELLHLDLQPPLQYLLTRCSFSMFGDGNLATRLPSVLGFTVASVCLYHYVRRDLGRFYGLAAVLVFWLSPFLRYATEARPYALMAGFLALAMLGWQAAIEGDRRRLGIFAVAFGVCGLLVSHVFGAVVVAFIGLAELVRSIDRRCIDWPVWAALVSPTPLVIIYIPILRRFQHWTAVPPLFQASPTQIVAFYDELLSSVGVVLLVGLMVALLISRSGEESNRNFPAAQKHEIALVLGLLSFPIAINLLLIPAGGAFWPRYGIPAAMGFSLLFVYILAKLTNASRAAAAIFAVFVLSGIVFGFVWQIVQPRGREMVKQFSLQQLDPRLPLVDAGGMTFVEMNKREDPALLARVFYLTDHDAALRYAHATIFEGSEILHKYWPIRGTVIPYAEFVRRTPHFFVLGTPDYPEDWLIPKLLDDGADLQFKGELRQSSYRDYMIFEVTMPSRVLPPRP